MKNAAGRVVAQPYFVYSPDFDVIAFAAMWSIWERPGALPVVSSALLSKAAAPSIAHIHHRMPIVLKPAQFDVWLSAETRASDVQHLMVNPLEDFEGYPVNTRVNSARNTGHELITRLD